MADVEPMFCTYFIGSTSMGQIDLIADTDSFEHMQLAPLSTSVSLAALDGAIVERAA